MRTTTLWIIRLALMVQFIGVLAVPALLAQAEAPRGMWLAEWRNPPQAAGGLSAVAREREGRTIGILELRHGKLAFTEQVGQADWSLDLGDVKSLAIVNDGRSLRVESTKGEAFETTIMEPDLTPQSPKKALSQIERAMRHLSTHTR